MRDGLSKARARAVLPSGSGAVTAIDTSSSGASASAVTSNGSRTVGALRASADGTLVLVGGADGEARVYDLASRRQLARLRLGAALRDAVFSPDGKSVFTGDANGIILRWDVRSGARLARAEHGAPIRDLAVSSDGNFVASAAGEAARVWLATDGSQVARLPHPFSVERVSFSVTGGQLLTVARDARVYDARNWGRPPLLLDQPGNIVTAAFSPAGDRVATGGRDNLAMIWDAGAGTRVAPVAAPWGRPRRCMVPERQPARDGEHGQRRQNLQDGDRRARDVPRRALEPGGRRRVQPGRHVGGHCLARRVGTHLGRGRLLTLGRAARPLRGCSRRGVHTGRRKRRDCERRRLRPGVEAGGRPDHVHRRTTHGRGTRSRGRAGRDDRERWAGRHAPRLASGRADSQGDSAARRRGGRRVLAGRFTPRHRGRRRRRARVGRRRRQAPPVLHARRATHLSGLRRRREAGRHRRYGRDRARVEPRGRHASRCSGTEAAP